MKLHADSSSESPIADSLEKCTMAFRPARQKLEAQKTFNAKKLRSSTHHQINEPRDVNVALEQRRKLGSQNMIPVAETLQALEDNQVNEEDVATAQFKSFSVFLRWHPSMQRELNRE